MPRSLRTVLLIASLTAPAAGCGGSDSTGPAAIASVSITASSQTISALGATTQLTAVARDGKGRELGGQTFTWTSSNSSVASVSGGLVTAMGNGVASISAEAGGITGKTDITVQQVPSQVTLQLSADTIAAIGETVQATASARDAKGAVVAGVSISFISTNPGVIAVTNTGLLTAVAEGSSVIRVTAGALQAEREVHVRQRGARLNFVSQPQGGRAGVSMSNQPTVEVLDSRGNRVTTDNSTVVSLSVATSGTSVMSDGVIVSGGTRTVQNGIATFAGLAVGGLAGNQRLRATAAGMSAAESMPFVLEPGDPSALYVTAGNNQTAPANTMLPQQLQATVQDSYGNSISGVPVVWSVVTGDGSLSAASAASNGSGVVSAAFTISKFVGQNVARVSLVSNADAAASFTAAGTPNATISGVVTGPSAAIGSRTSSSASRSGMSNQRRPAAARINLPLATLSSSKMRAKSSPAVGMVSRNVSDPVAQYVAEPFNGELLVIYRREAIQAPPPGAQAYRQRSEMVELQETIRSAVEPLEQAKVVRTISVSPAIPSARVAVAPGVTEAQAIARIRQDPRVLTVERNGTMSRHVVEIPSMSLIAGLATVSPGSSGNLASLLLPPGTMVYPGGGLFPDASMYVNQSWHYNSIGLPRAWEITTGSPDIIVAVVDDGIRFDHPAMAGMLTDDGYDFVPNTAIALCSGGVVSRSGDGDGPDPDPTIPSSRSYSSSSGCALGISASGAHGLHVSGTIASAFNNALGIVGVNRQVRIRPVRVMGIHGSGSFDEIAQGVLYAAGLPATGANGQIVQAQSAARVINMSLGGATPSAVLELAIQQATAAGALVVASSGNNNNSAPNYPAAYPQVLSVSAVGPTLTRAPYSTYGSTVDITAPGGNTNVNAGGGPTQGVYSSAWNFQLGVPIVDSWNGTSMAAPHVTGVAALVLSAYPTLTAQQLRARLEDFAVDIGAPGKDQSYGMGLVNARNSLTQSFAPPRSVKVHLIDANSGALVRTVSAASNGSYSFTALPDGEYWVFAGDDENADNMTGLPGRRWAAYGTAANPTTIVVNGAATHTATFPFNEARENESNNTAEFADVLPVDGYLMGTFSSMNDVDVYRVLVPQAGSYTFLAQGVTGACGFALEADPVMGLFDAQAAEIAFNDDIQTSAGSYCSRITTQLSPGLYYIQLQPYLTGRYVLNVRRN